MKRGRSSSKLVPFPTSLSVRRLTKHAGLPPKLDGWGIRLVTRRGPFTEEADSLLLPLLGIPEGLSSEDRDREVKKDWF